MVCLAGSPCIPPVVTVENVLGKETPETQNVLPDGTNWMSTFMQQIIKIMQSEVPVYRYNPRLRRLLDQNRHFKWLIPGVIALQYFLKKLVFDRALSEDCLTGDERGPYDAQTIARNRQKVQDDLEKKDLERELMKRIASIYSTETQEATVPSRFTL